MSWLGVFSACLAAVLVGGAIVAIVVAWIVGTRTAQAEPDPVEVVLGKMPEYPVDKKGELKGMEPEPEGEYEEPMSVRVD